MTPATQRFGSKAADWLSNKNAPEVLQKTKACSCEWVELTDCTTSRAETVFPNIMTYSNWVPFTCRPDFSLRGSQLFYFASCSGVTTMTCAAHNQISLLTVCSIKQLPGVESCLRLYYLSSYSRNSTPKACQCVFSSFV